MVRKGLSNGDNGAETERKEAMWISGGKGYLKCRGNSKCKGPEVRTPLVSPRISRKVAVERRRGTWEEVRAAHLWLLQCLRNTVIFSQL